MNEVKYMIGILAVTVVIIVAGILLTSSAQTSPSENQSILVQKDSIQMGPQHAKVTLVEFGDFQCPACAAAAPIVEQLLQNNKNSIHFVFRHFPLPQHDHAILASEVAEAANDQGKFFEMYQMLYANQNEWNQTSDTAVFEKYAKDLNLNLSKFKQSLEKHSHLSKITSDQKDGDQLGVNATPTFFLNGKKLELQSFSQLEQAVNSELTSK